MKKYYLLIVIVIALVVQGFCQIHQKAIPASFSQNLKQNSSVVQLPSQIFDTEKVPSKEEGLPLYAGYKIPFTETDRGVWQKSKAEWNIWRIGLSVRDAKGLNVYFKNLQLNKGDRIFIYNGNNSSLLGAFTKFNNGKFLATEFISGDKIIA